MMRDASRARSTDGGARKLRGLIAKALLLNCLDPAAAAIQLRGRVGFFSSFLTGLLGRGMMGPLTRRQYGANAPSLTCGLKRNLLRWYNAIGTCPPRSIPHTMSAPAVAHSDAQGFGHVAARALLPEDLAAPTLLPQRFIDMAIAEEADPHLYVWNCSCDFAGLPFDYPRRWEFAGLCAMY